MCGQERAAQNLISKVAATQCLTSQHPHLLKSCLPSDGAARCLLFGKRPQRWHEAMCRCTPVVIVTAVDFIIFVRSG